MVLSKSGAAKNQQISFSPFVPNAPFLYPLKTSENLIILGVMEGDQWQVKD